MADLTTGLQVFWRERSRDHDIAWTVDDSVPLGEANVEYLGIPLFGGIGISFPFQPSHRFRISSATIAEAIAVNLASAYRPEVPYG